MFKKEATAGLLLLIILILVGGCSGGSYVIKVGGIDVSDNALTGQYSSFSGHYFKKVEFEKDVEVTFNFTKNTEAGAINAKLLNSKEEEVTEIKEIKRIKIDKTDTYKVQVEGDDHKGSFHLSWEIE